MGYPTGVTGDFGEFKELLLSFKRRIDELERPIGTQVDGVPEAGVASSSSSNFAMTTSYAVVTSTTITIPDGYTRALVSVSAAVCAASGSGGGDRLYGRVRDDDHASTP